MTVSARWPSSTRRTTVMCVRQCASASDALPASMSDNESLLRADAPATSRRRVPHRPRPADRRHCPRDDLVQHLGDDGQGLIARQGDEALVKSGVGGTEAVGIHDHARLVRDEPPQLRDRRSPRSRRRDDANRDRLQQAARLVDVRQGHVARLQHQRRGTGRHALVRLVNDDATEHAAYHRDQAFRLENTERLAQRRPRHPEPLHQVRLVAERIPLGELP